MILFRSLRAKLVAIYLIIVVLFVVCLGATLSRSYKENLTQMREDSVVDCARQIAQMYADGSLAVMDLENGYTVPVLMTTAKDFDATIQIVNTTSKRIFYSMDEEKMTVYKTDTLVEDDIFDTVYNKGEIYVHSHYFNEQMGKDVSTVAYPIKAANSGPDDKPWAILIVNSALDTVNEVYSEIVESLWVPAIIVTLAGLITILVLSNGIVTRVRTLNSATQSIAKGKFDTRVTFKGKDEISLLARGFNKMAEDLKASDASKRDFVSNAAHELRSPMTSINGFVEGMLDGTIPPEKHRMYLEIVSSEVKRLTNLVRTMLDLSRIESGRDKLNLAVVDINELIRRVVIRLGQKIENGGILPEIDISDAPLLVKCDSDKIEQVLQNLMDNAIKFTPEGKALILRTERKGESVYVTVKDEGAGISRDELKLIWDRFYTVDKARSGKKTGTGLGLSIVKSIIDLHNSTITVSSEIDQGTEFVFTLEYAGD